MSMMLLDCDELGIPICEDDIQRMWLFSTVWNESAIPTPGMKEESVKLTMLLATVGDDPGQAIETLLTRSSGCSEISKQLLAFLKGRR